MIFQLNYILHYGPILCTSAAPKSVYTELYSALICGADLSHGPSWALFADTGLIHILVVSGAHLIFVERLFKPLPWRLRLSILAIYCWLTGFGAPVLRALVRRTFGIGLEPWGWSRLQIEALTSVLLLACYPPWLLSRSFVMSWICALAMQAPWPWKSTGRRCLNLDRNIKVYVFLYPFCPNSPLTILWNSLVGPAIGQILFPICALAFLLPVFTYVGDEMWHAILWILSTGPKGAPAVITWPMAWLWWAPVLLHTSLLIGEFKWRRAVAFL